MFVCAQMQYSTEQHTKLTNDRMTMQLNGCYFFVQYKRGLRLILARMCMMTQFLLVVFRLLKEIYDLGYNTQTKLMTEPLFYNCFFLSTFVSCLISFYILLSSSPFKIIFLLTF